eukprot:7411600-Alexandrium_andersonii.AAC.1
MNLKEYAMEAAEGKNIDMQDALKDLKGWEREAANAAMDRSDPGSRSAAAQRMMAEIKENDE